MRKHLNLGLLNLQHTTTMDNGKLPLSNGETILDATNCSAELQSDETHSEEMEYTQLNCDMQELSASTPKLNGKVAAIQAPLPVEEMDDALNLYKNESDAMSLKYRDLQLEYEESLAQSAEDRVKLKRDNATLRLELEAASSFSKAAQIVKLRQQNEKLNSELDELRQQHENIQTEYEDLSNQLMDSLQEEEDLRDKYSKLEMENNALMKQLSNPIEPNTELDVPQNSESSTQRNESTEHLQRHVERLTADNALLCAANKSLLESTEQTISEMRVEINKLSTELLDKSAFVEKNDPEETKVSKEIVEALTKTIDCLQREKSQLKQQLDDAVAEKFAENCAERTSRIELEESPEREKQQLENSIESSKSKTEQELKQENDHLRLALEQVSASTDMKQILHLQDEASTMELSKTEESARLVDQLQSANEKLEKSLEQKLETIETLAAEKQQLENSFEEIQLAHADELQLLKLDKDNLSLALKKEHEIIRTLTEEKQQMENSIASIKTMHEDALQALQEEKNKLSVALELQRQVAANFESKEEALRLKTETLTHELQETSAKLLVLEQLQTEHEKFVKALVLAKQENHELSHQIQKMEAAQRSAAEYQVTAETQLAKLRADSIAAAQERTDLLFEQQRLEGQISDDHATLQTQRLEFESTLAALERKSKSLQQANVRLQSTNSNLGEQLQTVTRQVSECGTLRRQLERLAGEHEELQRRTQASIAETTQGRRDLEADVAQHKAQLAQSIKDCNSYRTLLDTRECAFKDDKLKLENTVSCLLLEKQTLEEKLYRNEALAKKQQVELSALRLKADVAETTSLDRHEIQQLKNPLMPIKMSSPFLERKNRRLRTHDERRSQSIQAISNSTEAREAVETCNSVAGKVTPNGHC